MISNPHFNEYIRQKEKVYDVYYKGVKSQKASQNLTTIDCEHWFLTDQYKY